IFLFTVLICQVLVIPCIEDESPAFFSGYGKDGVLACWYFLVTKHYRVIQLNSRGFVCTGHPYFIIGHQPAPDYPVLHTGRVVLAMYMRVANSIHCHPVRAAFQCICINQPGIDTVAIAAAGRGALMCAMVCVPVFSLVCIAAGNKGGQYKRSNG